MLRVYYGGSFDPVHNGHLAIARAARDRLHAQVALVPARDPPHKPPTGAGAEQRAEMLELAIAGEPGLRVDRRELARPGPSYTVDTLIALRAEYGPQAPIAWLIGADALRQLHTWSRWTQLFALAHIVAVARPGFDLETAALRTEAPAVLAEVAARRRDPETLAASPAGGFALLELPQLRPESSSELRRRIAAADPRWCDWVQPAVAAQIVQQGLYGVSTAILPASPSSARP
ncbi:nicotinate-nucleotide adenylyltransferase [Thermomonas sp.]|uniref:nicotinate-nucleotide adenylyltransferase n=1 Tax=Thermomonas sp. TaxID=1971895 RepID=UPI002B7050C1|nr:nicotinate-nucleotide adenylyltransferase [Thermomonas sp.]HRO62978.1 nicotinate-nucleotide adenylyltransferase [Thermomonas sp.]